MARMPRNSKKLVRDMRRVKKDLKSSKSSRRNATRALAQSAAAAPRRNFGTSGITQSVNKCIRALDARLPRTVGLPRAVGPYSVIRTTRLWSSSADVIMFAPFSDVNGIYNWCGLESIDGTLPINSNSPENNRPITIPLAELASAAEVAPASLTVQVMNPSSLQTAEGVFAMGRVNQPFNYGGTNVTWNEVKARFISFFSPRLLTGGKLALRGVKCSSYPLDMTEYADFRPVIDYSVAQLRWLSDTRCTALAPIMFVQSNSPTQTMEFLITVEWRVRFDPGNPAVASHCHHDITSDAVCNGVTRSMSSMGHGVEELAEDVMELGALGGAGRLAAAALL